MIRVVCDSLVEDIPLLDKYYLLLYILIRILIRVERRVLYAIG